MLLLRVGCVEPYKPNTQPQYLTPDMKAYFFKGQAILFPTHKVILLLPWTNRKISKDHVISVTVEYNQDYCFRICLKSVFYLFFICRKQLWKRRRKRTGSIITSCTTKPLHSLLNNYIHISTSHKNTKKALQQAVRRACFAQLVPGILLEINLASTLLKEHTVQSWCRTEKLHTEYPSFRTS